MIRTIIAVILALIILGSGIFIYYNYKTPQKQQHAITSFDDCQNAGYPIQESYPPRCTIDDGQVFTQDIGNELVKMDFIRSENPRPNQIAKSPLVVRGQARGMWYFEATFPIKLVDNNGNIIAESFAQASGDWMTEDFVPYEGQLIFETAAKEGKLILEKSNPSGLPERADYLEIPVKLN